MFNVKICDVKEILNVIRILLFTHLIISFDFNLRIYRKLSPLSNHLCMINFYLKNNEIQFNVKKN